MTDIINSVVPEEVEISTEETEVKTDESAVDVSETYAEEGEEKYTAPVSVDTVDYAKLMEEDVATLKAQFPELKGIKDLTDLNNPLRYAALRDLGLTAEEAYLATAKRVVKDTRSHLKSAHGKSAGVGTGMSYSELTTARELFPGKNDTELERLYKKVSK